MDVADVAVDVFGHLMLLLGRRGDLGVHVADHVHRLANLPEAAARFTDAYDRLLRHFQARMHLLGYLAGAFGQVAQQPVDFRRGVGRAFGQGSHFVGDHRETTALFTGTCGLDGGVQSQQVGLLGNRTNGPENRLNVVAVALQLLHRLGRLFDFLAQAIDAGHGGVNLLLAFAGLALATVGRFGGLAARAGHFVGGGDHFVERGGHHVHGFTLTSGRFGHVVGDLGRALGGVEDFARGAANALNQVADRRQELVEPVGQLRGFIATTDLQVLGQVALTLGDAFQSAGHAADRAHDKAGETGADDGEEHRQHGGDDGDQPGQLGCRTHDFALLDQADEGPAQLLRRPDVGHVALAVELDFDQTFTGLGQLRVTVAEAAQGFEVMFRLFRVHQHGAGVFHQHQVAGLTQFDLFDDFGELLERHVDVDHATLGTQLVGHGAHGTHQHGVIAGPVIGFGAHSLARVGHRRFVPGTNARIVVGHFGVARPERITTTGQAVGHVGVSRMTGGQGRKQIKQLGVDLGVWNFRGVSADAAFHAGVGCLDQGLVGQVLDVLADAVEKQLHGVADLTNLAAAAVDEIVLGIAAQVQHHEGGDQYHGQAGDDCKRPRQLLFDIHPRSIFCCNPRSAEDSRNLMADIN